MSWIVAIDEAYYPHIEEFDTYEEAKETYDSFVEKKKRGDWVYLAEVKVAKKA
jgi:hypothetical protein